MAAGASATAGTVGKDEEKPARRVGHIVLTIVGIVVSALLLPVLAVNLTLIARSIMSPDEVPSVGGLFPMIVMTDSMYPEIQAGDLIVGEASGAEGVSAGDVVSFTDPDGDGTTVVTHRVIEVRQGEGGAELVTRGDANNADDPTPVPAASVIGRYRWRVPGLGRAVLWMQTPAGLALSVGAPAAALVAWDLVRRRRWERAQAAEAEALAAELERLRAAGGGA